MAIFGKKEANTGANEVTYQCSACGAKATANDKFCVACGSPIVASSAETNAEAGAYSAENNNANEGANANGYAENGFSNDTVTDKKAGKKSGKKILKPIIIIAAIAIVVALVVALVVVIVSSSSKFVVTDKVIYLEYDGDKEKTLIMVNGEIVDEVKGKWFASEYSMDGSVVVFGIADEDDSSEGTLYSYDGGIQKIGKITSASNLKLSAEGKGLAYVDEEDTLYVYEIGDDKPSKAAEDVSEFVLSPDGKSVAFVDDDGDLNVYSDGEATKIEDEARPLGLSNGAKLVYYAKEGDLYVNKGGEDERLLKDYYSCKFNSDCTQAAFGNSKGDLYVYEDGEEKKKIGSDGMGSYNGYRYSGHEVDNITSSEIFITPLKTFKNIYFTDSKGVLWFVDGSFEAHEVAEDVRSFMTTKSQDVVYYEDDSGDLFRITSYDADPEQIGEDVSSYYITENGSGCYYTDTEETLFFAKKANKGEKVAEDVDYFQLSHDGYAFFMIDMDSEGGTLYSSRNGSEKEKVTEKDVVSFGCSATYTVYMLYEDYEDEKEVAYVATSGTSFEKVEF